MVLSVVVEPTVTTAGDGEEAPVSDQALTFSRATRGSSGLRIR